MENQLQKQNNKVTFSAFMTSNKITNRVQSILGDEKTSKRFVSSIISAVSNNPQLKECDNYSILSGALLGEGLGLSPSPTLGRFYLVPFKDKERGMVAQFILGYKGYLELAQRSGQYKDINVIEIRKGEYKGRNKTTGNPEFEFIEDDDIREKTEIIGYMASFTLLNGFTKTIYWSTTKMKDHALKYSSGYRADVKNKTQYTFWSKDFTGQAFKTLLRQLISKWGILSIEMMNAYDNDMAVIDENGNKSYVDNDLTFDYEVESQDIKVEEEKKEETPKEAKKLSEI